jgi:hypothetical protein
MLIHLVPMHGGDGTEHGIIAMNDTGSDILTLFTVELLQLGNMQQYTSWRAPRNVVDSNGNMTPFPTLPVQVRLVRNDNTSWGGWINEFALVKPVGPRLTGTASGIRHVLWEQALAIIVLWLAPPSVKVCFRACYRSN